MPSPSSSLATLRPDIADSLMTFDGAMSRQGFIGHRVLPVFEVGKPTGTFGKIPLAQLLQNRDVERAPGSGYSRGSFKFETQTYAARERGAEEPVDDREAQIYRDYFDAEMVAAERAMDVVLRNAEMRAADLIFHETDQSAISMFADVTNEWDDFTNATPITDVETAVRAVWAKSGLWPNALVINRHVFRNLRQCAQIIARIESGGAGVSSKQADITADMLARCFDLEEVIVGGEPKNTAGEGQTATVSKIWSDEYAAVCRIAKRPRDIREPSIGRTFHYAGDGSAVNGTVENYRDETVRSNIIRVRHDVEEKVYYREAEYLLGNITT